MDKSLIKYIEKYKRELVVLKSERDVLSDQLSERRGVFDISYYNDQIKTLDAKIEFWENAFASNNINL